MCKVNCTVNNNASFLKKRGVFFIHTSKPHRVWFVVKKITGCKKLASYLLYKSVML